MPKEKTFIKGLGFCGNEPLAGSNAAAVDVVNGSIVRIRPLHFDWKYKPEDMNPWKIKARGKTFEPLMKTLLPPFTLAYKKRAYSPNRIKYPLKRIDWDPHGERNPQNRGKSKFKRISWDEAADIIASEIERVEAEYVPCAILSFSGAHGETKALHYAHGTHTRLLSHYLGDYSEMSGGGPDSWEGWFWGAKHVWGMTPNVGEMAPLANCFKDIAENTDMILFWGCDPETTPHGWDGQLASRIYYWWTELGIKSVYVCPDLNYGAAVHANKWIPVLPNTDVALHLAISYVWITEGTYDKDYVATHTHGFKEYEKYVLGREDGVPKTPAWASPLCGVPEWTIKALARKWASKTTSIAHGNGGSYIRGPYSHEPARLEVLNLAMQGVGKPGRHQVKMIEWNHKNGADITNPLPRPRFIPNIRKAVRGGIRGKVSQKLPLDLFSEADGLIIGSPVYTHSYTSKFRLLMERIPGVTLFQGHLTGKPAGAITVAAVPVFGGQEHCLHDINSVMQGIEIIPVSWKLGAPGCSGHPFGPTPINDDGIAIGVKNDLEAKKLAVLVGRRVAEYAVMLKLSKRELGEVYTREFMQHCHPPHGDETWAWSRLDEEDKQFMMNLYR